MCRPSAFSARLTPSTSSSTTRLHKTIWPKDAPRAHKCKPPCMMFEWLGCDNQCRTQGCEVLQKITVEEVLGAVQIPGSTSKRGC